MCGLGSVRFVEGGSRCLGLGQLLSFVCLMAAYLSHLLVDMLIEQGIPFVVSAGGTFWDPASSVPTNADCDR